MGRKRRRIKEENLRRRIKEGGEERKSGGWEARDIRPYGFVTNTQERKKQKKKDKNLKSVGRYLEFLK